jgi:hypothetical protein
VEREKIAGGWPTSTAAPLCVQLVFAVLSYDGHMEKDVIERFERIEGVLERVGERLGRITEGHVELEDAQKNTTIALNRFIDESNKRGAEVDERITNLTILVDQLIKRDFNGNGH